MYSPSVGAPGLPVEVKGDGLAGVGAATGEVVAEQADGAELPGRLVLDGVEAEDDHGGAAVLI